MTRLALIALLALATLVPPRQAAAQDAVGGAIVGGVGGAILGGALGGSRGAAVGAVLGATTGAAVASQGDPRPGGYYYYQNACYLPQPDGTYVAVDPAYCAAAASAAALLPPRNLRPAAGPGLHALADVRSARRHVHRPQRLSPPLHLSCWQAEISLPFERDGNRHPLLAF